MESFVMLIGAAVIITGIFLFVNFSGTKRVEPPIRPATH